ncbi:hypothetical protein HHK36_017967 [Tetracentron sinense]|uniref:MBD domain-containing protein n=1 Tax=Tetracentron sinense TaxID=13715 RepID=A0A834YXQ5_TETSI|nr:hypothetical protein HHK36_017967 [Tetracentron sinense]
MSRNCISFIHSDRRAGTFISASENSKMANSSDKEEIPVAEKETPLENHENREEIVSVDLPAPIGWKKKFTPKKGGSRGTPKRNEIVFISPTGDTPRRSARITEKSKATETPEREPPKKRERKSSSKKGEKEKKDNDDGADEAAQEEEAVDAAATAEETKASVDVEMKEAEGLGDKNEEEVATGEAVSVEDTVKQDTEQKAEEKIEEMDVEKPEDQEANKKPVSDSKEEKADSSLPPPEEEVNKEKVEENQAAESEAPPPSSMPYSEKEAKAAEEAKLGEEARLGESLTENSSLKESQENKEPTEKHSINCEKAQHQPKASSVSC